MAERNINQGPEEMKAAPKCDFSGCTADAAYVVTLSKPAHYCETHADLVLGVSAALDNPTTTQPALRQITVVAG